MVSKQYSKVNHPSVSHYDPALPHHFILFLDGNNLYGKAMMESLPVGGFRWMSRDELTVENVTSFTDDGEEGCFVECTLSYPNPLHDVYDDSP